MNWKIKNIKEIKTTIVAIIIIIATLLMVFYSKASFSEIWPAWLLSLYLLGIEDHRPPPAAAIFLIALFFTSCSAQARLSRIIKNNPYLKTSIVDTVHFDTTIILNHSIAKFQIPIKFDSIKMQTNAYDLQFYKTKDSIYGRVQLIPDTVFISKPILFHRIKLANIQPKATNWIAILKLALSIIIGIIILILVIRFIKW